VGQADHLGAVVIPFDRVPTDQSTTELRDTDRRGSAADQEVVGLGEAVLTGMPPTAGPRSTSASDSGR
jgi:hypothetical protein